MQYRERVNRNEKGISNLGERSIAMGFFKTLFGSGESQPEPPKPPSVNHQAVSKRARNSINLDSVRDLLNEKNSILKSGALDESNFYAGYGDPPEIRDSFNAALDYKRRGDLNASNRCFCESFRKLKSFHSPFIWSWCKVMILAKNWECLRDLLEHHFNMMVVWNRLMKKNNDQLYFDSYAAFNMVPYFEFSDFHAGEALRDQVHAPLMEKSEAVARLAQYGGSPYWEANYSISDSEWREFQNTFPLPEL